MTNWSSLCNIEIRGDEKCLKGSRRLPDFSRGGYSLQSFISIFLIDYTIGRDFPSRNVRGSQDESFAQILTERDDREKWRVFPLNNFSIGQNDESRFNRVIAFQTVKPIDFCILDFSTDFITRVEKRRRCDWTGKVSKVSPPLVLLFESVLSSSFHPATWFSLYLLARNFSLFEIERIVSGSRK